MGGEDFQDEAASLNADGNSINCVCAGLVLLIPWRSHVIGPAYRPCMEWRDTQPCDGVICSAWSGVRLSPAVTIFVHGSMQPWTI